MLKSEKKQQKNKKTKTGQHLTEDGSKIKKIKEASRKSPGRKECFTFKESKTRENDKKN